MITRELLGTALVPGGEELRLFAHGRDFMIVLGHNELMSTRMRGSEEALATMTAQRLKGTTAQNWLIGGYGMGFTLRAALGVLGADARITVAELVPEIIDWARGPMAEVAAGCLDDPRVRLSMGDVADAILLAPEPLDAILLDVDNGPEAISQAGNRRLYNDSGVRACAEALVPGGVVGVWSAGPNDTYAARMKRHGLATEVLRVPVRKGARATHVIFIGKRARA